MRFATRLSVLPLLIVLATVTGAISGRAASDTSGRIVFSDPLIQSIYKGVYDPTSEFTPSPWGYFTLWKMNPTGGATFFEWRPTELVEGSNWLEWRWQGSDVSTGFSELSPGQIAEHIDDATESHLSSFGHGIIEIVKPRPSFESSLKPPVNLRASQREFDHKIELTWDNPNASMPAGWGLSVYVGLTPNKENATRYHNIVFLNPLTITDPHESFSYPRQHPFTSLAPRWYFWVAYTHEGLEFVSENPEVWGAFRGAPTVPTMVWRTWPLVTRYHASQPRDTPNGAGELIITNQPPAIVIEQGVPLHYVLPSYTTLTGEILSIPPADTLLPIGTHVITVRLQPAAIGYSDLEVARTVEVVAPMAPPSILLKNPRNAPNMEDALGFMVEGLAGLAIRLESSPDLATWTPIGGMVYVPDNATEVWAQAPKNSTQLFYRAVIP